MGVQTRALVTIIDDSDGESVTVEPRSLDHDGPAHWQIVSSLGGMKVYVTSADLIEFASAVRALVDTDPFLEPSA